MEERITVLPVIRQCGYWDIQLGDSKNWMDRVCTETDVIDGPLFKRKVNVYYGERVLRNGHWFLDLKAKHA